MRVEDRIKISYARLIFMLAFILTFQFSSCIPANADDLDTATFLTAGADVVLIKPVTGDLLKSTLLNILQRYIKR